MQPREPVEAAIMFTAEGVQFVLSGLPAVIVQDIADFIGDTSIARYRRNVIATDSRLIIQFQVRLFLERGSRGSRARPTSRNYLEWTLVRQILPRQPP